MIAQRSQMIVHSYVSRCFLISDDCPNSVKAKRRSGLMSRNEIVT